MKRTSLPLRRREFITLLGAAAAWPVTARAQQATMPVIGFLNAGSPGGPYADRVRAFRQGLSETGYVEGRNVAIEFRWADGQYGKLPAMAADLVRRQVAVIVVDTPATLPARAATSTIPIVFSTAVDPVAVGLVASLNRPGGNITGVTLLNVELVPKRLELLHELVPSARIVAALVNPTNPAVGTQSRDLQAAARTIGLPLEVLHASTEGDFDGVFASLVKLQAGALVIGGDPLFTSHSEQFGALTIRHAMPAIYQTREFAVAGGLMSYIGGTAEDYRRIGVYTGRILKGERPADLPVQQSTRAELIVNLKTAKVLGLTVPLSLLTRADEVIE
jgi:putative ABC transport system substrate-binding protein